ncbi:MAG: PIN domain-containing protein [Bifidobacteriaceae bacterium]|nr:PIN domain-containing protein [Bifidobacteriaceae bacterium]
MIGIDTNVLVRFLTNDDPVASPKAQRWLTGRTTAEPAHIGLIVLVETLWVLRSAYGYGRAASRDMVRRLLDVGQVRVEQAGLVASALDLADADDLDLPDVLIALTHQRAGCALTVTLDRKASRIPGMKPLT